MTRWGLHSDLDQCSLSFNRRKGTLRGLHFQVEPFAETKVVRCTMGSIFDVVVDVRAGSPTFLKWHAVELSAENARALYVPAGFAHGFQTLADNCEVLYMISSRYHPEAARTVRYDDPAIAIGWPLTDFIMSPKDAAAGDARSVLGS